MAQQLVQSAFSRMFLLKNRASPTTVPKYEGLMRAGAATWDQGRVTTIFVPDANQYGKFVVAGKIPGEPGLPQLTVDARYTTDLSELLAMVAGECDHDLQLHIGECQNPQDFNAGWSKIVVLEGAKANSYSTTDLGALEPAHHAAVTETTKFDGLLLYEVKQLSFTAKATALTVEEVVDVAFCDEPSCGGDCGIASDGCQTLFALMLSSGGSPGLLPEVLFTTDGGQTWTADVIDSLAANSAPNRLGCVGPNLIVISSAANAIEWAASADIINGVETWAQVTSGFVAAKGPKAILSLSETNTWIVGVGGYIYFTSDPTSGVTVQDAGSVTTQDLNDIAALDLETLVAVGNSNAVVYTSDGGTVWASVTGPAVGINLNAVWMTDATEWWVAAANGKLYYTVNAGVTWHEKTFPGSGSGVCYDIKFSSRTVGYLAHTTSGNRGRILRTIDGGNSWYVLPEGKATLPTNQKIEALAVCANVNSVFGAGLGAGGTTGIVVQGG